MNDINRDQCIHKTDRLLYDIRELLQEQNKLLRKVLNNEQPETKEVEVQEFKVAEAIEIKDKPKRRKTTK